MNNNQYPFINTPLPYAFQALEPYIDATTMYLHHEKHLQTYIDNLNKLLAKEPKLQACTLEELTQMPGDIGRNSGGVYNHRFYFEGLQPPKKVPHNPLYEEIESQFQSFEAFQKIFKQTALSVFGSGYAWLVWERGMFRIITTANQDVPCLKKMSPILCIDVWEHAYYLKHYNLRGDYIDNWFKVINWETAQMRWQQGEPFITSVIE